MIKMKCRRTESIGQKYFILYIDSPEYPRSERNIAM